MPTWGEVIEEISNVEKSGGPSALHVVRRKYLSLLHDHTERNVISYYSGWLQKQGVDGVQINDEDMNGFMMCVHGMDSTKGLDLILHTPGGGITATESIVDYLDRKFSLKNIRVIVPQLAMSAGTIIACSVSEIIMGKQSSLGPIDPQLKGLPAYGVIHEFKRAHKEIKKDPSVLSVWQFILRQYHPTFLSECENAINLSKELVEQKLIEIMFKSGKGAKNKAKLVVKYLTNYLERKTHGRHINIDQCKKIGLKVTNLEDDQKLQDIILTIHHCYMYMLSNTPVFKIIENQKQGSYFKAQVLVPVENAKNKPEGM